MSRGVVGWWLLILVVQMLGEAALSSSSYVEVKEMVRCGVDLAARDEACAESGVALPSRAHSWCGSLATLRCT